ncbi:HAD family hydrolase [Micromonospora sp. RP3T]|uniref:HAD-IIIC family phosphatase n=1 Tax=Micromonospora sp. RP3T TaxID=2135446 RepID=UPI000D15BC21|nr:HAD-IIIC family phosphatase [Micromonospora sp. RP3T]PTA47672.1 methoxymalonyl-ACP biosynthesis protein FkbH [Micromonospora sp. RP3T]
MDGSEVRPSDPPATLLELHRSGRLAAEYPAVRGLLAGLSGAQLAQAGQLLSRLTPEAVLREHPGTPALTVAITGHGTLSALRPALTAEMARHGLLLRPFLADFDSYVFDLGDPGSALYAADPDLVLCVLDPLVVFDETPTPWRPADVERVLDEKIGLVERLAARFAGRARGTLVLNTMPLLRRFTAQLVDHRSRARLGAVWREANARLLRLTETHPAVLTVDLDPLLTEDVAASEIRMSIYAKAHLSAGLLAAYAREVAQLARHLAGLTRKALVLDLDGTVWGGVLSEDGPAGIEVGDGYRGEAFTEFQRVIKQLGAQGVLVAAVSKNDLAPVLEVLRDHPRMLLGEDDFVQVIANWRPKHENLVELAAALNLGVDSFVFADDSAYECGLVRYALPGVGVVALDDEPAQHVARLLHEGWFDVRELTDEDTVRPARYREDLVRKTFLDTFDSIEEYLRELDVRVRLVPATGDEAARVSQLTLRTNQFNLTSRRLQVPDIRDRLADPDASVLAVHASDRFGDNGLVGAVLLRRDGTDLHIDNFLLSCRAFSRGIEQACLSSVLRHARDTGTRSVYAAYRATPKNGMVRDFYPRNGFERLTDDGVTTTFRHDLAQIAAPPATVTLTDFLGVNA